MVRAFVLALWLTACTADHHSGKGQSALDRHDLSNAERHYREALQRDPVHLEALRGLGWTYHLAGQRDAARASFERCIDLSPEDVVCLRGLGSIALAEGDQPRARRLVEQAWRNAPEDPDVTASMALLDLVAGDYDVASERYEGLVRRYPDRGEFCIGLGEVRFRQDRPAETLELAQQGLRDEDMPRRHRARLWLLMARALIKSTAGREDPARCAETAPPIFAWLDEADAALDQAQATGVELPDLPAVRRLVLKRRGLVEDACPGSVASDDASSGT